MTPEENKRQHMTMWLISVAVAVLCCAGLFVVFASFMVDLKASVADNGARIAIIEKRQDRMASELDLLSQHGMIQSGVPAGASEPAASGISISGQASAPPSVAADGTTDDSAQAPTTSPTSAPAWGIPPAAASQMAPTTVAPAPTAPSVTVPVMPATPDKK